MTDARALVFWMGIDPMPKWRMDCVDTLKHFHPELDIDFVWKKISIDRPDFYSDCVRKEYCCSNKYRLWVDSDIEILSPLPLGDEPFLANENGAHLSIVWSGSNPSMIKQKRSWTKTYATIKKTIKPNGIYRHWQTGPNGERVPRTDLGYKSEDFI